MERRRFPLSLRPLNKPLTPTIADEDQRSLHLALRGRRTGHLQEEVMKRGMETQIISSET